MKQIKFSHNWNGKLELSVFTTIRGWTKEKEAYYKQSIAENFEVLLKGKKICIAELQEVEAIEFSDIPSGLIMYDTGLPYDDAYQVFADFGLMQLPNNKALILTFKFASRGN